MWLLDTNICVYLLNGNEHLKQKVRKTGVQNLAVSNAVLAELYFGAYNSTKVKANIATIESFRKHLTIFADSVESARQFGKIKADLKRQGKRIEDFDILVASIALANKCRLVTHNTNHFARIAGLHVEDWLASP
ncbi:type II toxin-antitoxin system VapC family toxin [Geobacter argillaceus]|uniref:Ribonuclease VapC n=1 Tax=Geobacter argillaceus TaxID=345631 RepID=A0A562VFY0_9BACT|nr:type II toxin-antitoxin system VapC family toxin [Geobacter argillaceus]TWJ16704.1 tRNA(fMet)-specific endonuclease VapC [Geobacter argillaceus]